MRYVGQYTVHIYVFIDKVNTRNQSIENDLNEAVNNEAKQFEIEKTNTSLKSVVNYAIGGTNINILRKQHQNGTTSLELLENSHKQIFARYAYKY